MPASQSVSRSRLELTRDEVDRVFGDGHAAAHPELVCAVVHAASSDWAARVPARGAVRIGPGFPKQIASPSPAGAGRNAAARYSGATRPPGCIYSRECELLHTSFSNPP
jgi:hypothetical protein